MLIDDTKANERICPIFSLMGNRESPCKGDKCGFWNTVIVEYNTDRKLGCCGQSGAHLACYQTETERTLASRFSQDDTEVERAKIERDCVIKAAMEAAQKCLDEWTAANQSLEAGKTSESEG